MARTTASYAYTPDTAGTPRFERRARLGAGGMGTVYRAWDRLLGREVALKVGRQLAEGVDTARIGDEFALLSTLDHPGLVRVLDFGLADGATWLTSEIVEGPRLDAWPARKEPTAATRMAVTLLETLAWLHARGVMHGDIKPANVLIGPAGPVLIDFGLAGPELFGATPAYAAPELLRGAAPSPASDLFALGRTLERLAVPALEPLVVALTRERAARRATVAQALAMLGGAAGVAPAGIGPTADVAAVPWQGAVERVQRALAEAHVAVSVPRAERDRFLAALAARAMLAGRPAWRFGAGGAMGAGLAPFLRVAAALGLEVERPAVRAAEDQKEVQDVFADRLIAALATVPAAARPLLLVADLEALGPAGRYVLARLVEAQALPGVVVVSASAGGAVTSLERGAANAFSRVEVLASEAGGRRWEEEWAALSPTARDLARELAGLGGAARPEELPEALRVALPELAAAGLSERAAAGRTGLLPEVAEVVVVLDARAPGDDERTRWLAVLEAAREPGEAMARRRAELAGALGRSESAEIGYRAAASAAEAAFAWARAAGDRVALGRLALRRGDAGEAFVEARAALGALLAVGGGPLVAEAVAIASRAAADRPGLAAEAAVVEARAALLSGDLAAAIAAADRALGEASAARRTRLDALLVRGAARSHGEDKALAERDLALAEALAGEEDDLHALGRTANNLGMLAFHRGDLAAAEAAWARTAEAKRKVGDRRGERIGRHNRGLALRELGRLDEAEEAAGEAAALAEAIGDRVGRATAALARAQLALDRGDAAAAGAALAAFDEVPWKPATVVADGDVVRLRAALEAGQTAEAGRLADAVLERALLAGNEPVACEAWALRVCATRRTDAPPPTVAAAIARAPGERGGLAALLLCAHAFGEAEAGRWGAARATLETLARRFGDGGVPPAARVGLGLARAAARLVDPTLEAAFAEASRAARAAGVAGVAAGAAVAAGSFGVARWVERIRAALGVERVELVACDGEVVIAASRDAAGGPRFGELFGKVAGGERFVARDAAGHVVVVALPLALERAPGSREPEVVGALVVTGGREDVLDEAARTALSLVVALEVERRTTARLTAEVARLERAAKESAAAHDAELTSLRDRLEQSQSALALRFDYGGIVHRSAAMRRILETLDKVTDRELPVLVTGETGVGKELLARALHFNGPRRAGRFVAENCGAIPKDLFESQFFGHVKGAFTGAVAARQGLFEQADGGTLFLDEIGELPLEMQVKLLRVLQERVVRPVGSNREVRVDFRLVCATHRDLAQMVQEGRFREDLFYRIAVVRLDVPPLRKRPEDIVPIAEKLLALHAEAQGRTVRLTPEAADRLAAYPFPGNVRELDNELLRALALTDGSEIKPRHLSSAVLARSEPKRRGDGPDGGGLETLEAAFARVEKELLVRHLRASGGQKVAAARSLGLSRPGLDGKLARHGIDVRELTRSLKEPAR